MSVLELTKNAPKDEESSERSGIFSSLFSGDRDTGTKCELKFSESEGERIDRLAKVVESALIGMKVACGSDIYLRVR